MSRKRAKGGATAGPLRLQLGHLALELRDLQLRGLHPTVSGECVLDIIGEGLHPIAQLRRMHLQVLRSLRVRDPSIPDQPYCFKLELPRKPPSLHDPPPAPSPNSVSLEPGAGHTERIKADLHFS